MKDGNRCEIPSRLSELLIAGETKLQYICVWLSQYLGAGAPGPAKCMPGRSSEFITYGDRASGRFSILYFARQHEDGMAHPVEDSHNIRAMR